MALSWEDIFTIILNYRKITPRINVHIYGVHTTIQILDLRSTTTEEKSPITICLDTTQYIIVTLHTVIILILIPI